MERTMHSVTLAPAARPAPIPVREILLIFASVLAIVSIYFIGVEQGGIALISGLFVHEFVHDGRHLLAFPCH
jgi:hypothetical protein